MRSIHIKASREYDVLVERGLLDRAGELLREVSAPGMAAIVSDDTVYALYGERTVKALEKAGYRVHSFTFPAGESRSFTWLSNSMSSKRGGTSTIGAPTKRFALAYLKPENCVPAIG